MPQSSFPKRSVRQWRTQSQRTPNTGRSFQEPAACAKHASQGQAWASEAAQEDINADQKKALVQLRNEFMEKYRD
jgi:hypothetical protein